MKVLEGWDVDYLADKFPLLVQQVCRYYVIDQKSLRNLNQIGKEFDIDFNIPSLQELLAN